MLKRALNLNFIPNPVSGSAATFLWGARQTGKTTLLKTRFPGALYFDLLDSDLATELTLRPKLFRERVLAAQPNAENLVVLDEVQKVPALLDEVHWLLENTPTQIVLCGSSARKLRRGGANLLGGRAVQARLLPLVSAEIPDLDLERYLNHGGLPAHYLSRRPNPLLRSYVHTYLKQEIIDEAATRNIPAFSRFLQVVALTHGRQLNYANVARECGVSASTVRSYYQTLLDTLVGFALAPWRRRARRRLVETAKFYLFDVGVALHLHPETPRALPGTDVFGRAFEHFIINEVRAYLAYRERDDPLAFWRTHSGHEVDLVVGDMAAAIECKSAPRVPAADLRGIRALLSERPVGKALVVCREEAPRTTDDGVELWPWRLFCQRLWDGELV